MNVVMDNELETRAKALIGDELFEFYWESVEHFGETDLILYFDADRDDVRAYDRKKFIEPSDAPQVLKEKFAKPAKDAAVNFTKATTAFWFMASFPEGTHVTAVIAQRIGSGSKNHWSFRHS